MARDKTIGVRFTGDGRGLVSAARMSREELEDLRKTTDQNARSARKMRGAHQEAEGGLKSMAKEALSTKGIVAGLGGVIAGVSFVGFARGQALAAKEARAYAQSLQVSTEVLTGWQYAAQDVGLEADKVADIMKDASDKIGDAWQNGGGEAMDAIEAMNLSAERLARMSPDQQILAIADGLDQLDTHAAKVNVLESLGDDATRLYPLLKDDAALLRELTAEADAFGVTLTKVEVEQLHAANREMMRAQAGMTGIGQTLTVKLAPALADTTSLIADLIKMLPDLETVTITTVGAMIRAFKQLQYPPKFVFEHLMLAHKRYVQFGKDMMAELLEIVADALQALPEWVVPDTAPGIAKMREFATELRAGRDELETHAEVTARLNAELEEGVEQTDRIIVEMLLDAQARGKVVDAAEDQATANAKARKSTAALSDEQQDLLDTLFPLEKQQRELTATIVQLNDMREQELITNEKYIQAIQILQNEYHGLNEETEKNTEALDQNAQAAGAVAQIYEDTASSIRDSFRGAFRDALDGQNSFAERMKDVFKDMLADMATMAITRPIIIPMVQGMGGMMGVPVDQQMATIQQLGGGYSYGGIGGQQGAMLAAQTGDFGMAGQSATAAAAAGSWMQGMGPGLVASAYMAAGYGGYQYGARNGELSGAKYGGAAGALQGMQWFGPIGGVIGAAIGTKLSDALGLGGGYTDPGGRIGMGGASGGYGGYMNASGAFGSIGWADGAHHVGGSDKTPAAKAYFEALAELDDAIASFLTEDEVARVKSALDGWTSAAAGAFEDFGAMSKERLGAIFEAVDDRLGQSMDDFSGSAEEAANYATQLAAAWQQHNQVLKGVKDTIAGLNGETINTLARFDSAINDSLTALINTDDFVEQQQLESQLYDQVMARYQAEQQMLGQLHGTLGAMSSAIGNLRAAIGADIARITGTPTHRNYADIFNEVGNINKPEVPLLADNDAESITRYREELEQYAEVSADQIEQLRRLREETLAYYEAQQQLEQAMSGAAGNIGATLNSLRRDRMSASELLDEDLAQFNDLMAQAGSASGLELAQIAEQLNALANPLLAEAESVYASGQGYQDIYDLVTGALSDVQGQLLTEAPQDYQQQSVDLLMMIDGQLASIEQNLSTQDMLVVDAIDRSRQETVQLLEHLVQIMEPEGSHAAGLAWVPNDGYRAELHQGEAVIDAKTMQSLRRYGIPAAGGGATDSQLLPILQRMERLEQARSEEGPIYITVMTPDGNAIVERAVTEVVRRHGRREILVEANQ